jgi:hypothetical protein
MRLHIGRYVRGVLRVVDSGIWHESIAIYGLLRWSGRPHRLRHHTRTAHAPDVVSRRWPGPDVSRLRGMASLHWMTRMRLEGHAVGNWRRRRRGVTPDVRKGWLTLELGRNHVRVNSITVGRSAVLIILVVLVVSTVEVGRALVLIRAAVLVDMSIEKLDKTAEADLHRCIV